MKKRKIQLKKGNEEAVKELGIQYLSEMIDKLLEKKTCQGFHFYTLNLEKSVTKIVQENKNFSIKVCSPIIIEIENAEKERNV